MPGGAKGLLQSLLVCLALLTWAVGARADAPDPGFSDWAAVVVAGDWRGHTGTTQAFDNARRDVSAAFIRAGFDRRNLHQFSLRPDKAGDDLSIVVQPPAVTESLIEAARQAKGGCLFYLTSHGAPDGAVFGPETMLSPAQLDQILTRACGPRPTVAIISACFSGIFVNGAMRPNRMIITAARPDRTSFGCGERNRYPYFDACILESLPKAATFPELATLAQACVARMETETGMAPPSEPQVRIGSGVAEAMQRLHFKHGP
ncbi:MAG: C13 family peptidase [Caulobacteraceae bacterium]|nr:C13 family peptidase [Caulobacteraceae bacterium]